MARTQVNLWLLDNDTVEFGEDGQITRVRTFRARLSGPTDSAWPVETYRLCPRRWDAHPADGRCRCVGLSVDFEDNKRFAGVTATYTNRFEAAKDDDKSPLERRAKISIKTMPIKTPFLFDVKGKPHVNTAGEPFAESTTTIPGRVWSIQKFVAVYPDWLLDHYTRSTNSDFVRIRGKTCPKGTLHLGDVSIGDEESDNGIPYYSLGLELIFNPLGWKRRELNRGFYEKVTRLGPHPKTGQMVNLHELKKIALDGDGELPSEPQWLDENGHWVKPQDDSGRIDPKKIIVLEFDEFYELPYGRLPLR